MLQPVIKDILEGRVREGRKRGNGEGEEEEERGERKGVDKKR